MKNLKLLLATTAMLSVGAMMAKADLDDNQTTLDIYALLVSPITANQTQYLSFGVIQIGPNSAKKKVVVGTNDALATSGISGATTTASLLLNRKVNYDGISVGDIRSGKIEFTGPFGHENITDSAYFLSFDDDTDGTFFKLSFTDAVLTPDGTGSGLTTCGTVKDFEYVLENDGEGTVTASIGATLTLADSFTGMSDAMLGCKGQSVVTWIIDPSSLEE